ncbi:hypothetical protein FZO89_14965 [Luteimonas viscosa]|uniref:Uncharacterized protein n=1 Tax=Luteimonas viscosa TaxID=1132694 RepID=A0A5D4XHX1_9GAMM|nr:hypothetical protein [Luteimonas viscosa]TYT23553.1 hypothetical protein FZO89_14965 [Luteimonas viscosa]
MVAIGTVLILAAWWLLAVAMSPGAATRRRALRLGAVAALVASLACYVVAIGVEQGPVFWTAVLMLGALAVALLRAIAGEDGSARRGRR